MTPNDLTLILTDSSLCELILFDQQKKTERSVGAKSRQYSKRLIRVVRTVSVVIRIRGGTRDAQPSVLDEASVVSETNSSQIIKLLL